MKRPLKIALLILLFITISMGSGFYYVFRSLNDPLDPSIDPNVSDSTR